MKLLITSYEFALMSGLRLAIKKYQVLGIGMGLVFFIMYSSYALAFWYGCQLLLNNLLTPGDVFTVFFSVLVRSSSGFKVFTSRPFSNYDLQVGAFALGNAVPYVAAVGIAQGKVQFQSFFEIVKIKKQCKSLLKM